MVYFLCKAYDSGRQNCCFALSLPVRGAWVEIGPCHRALVRRVKSLPVRGAWVEIAMVFFSSLLSLSLPVRGAWVEIARRSA